MIQSEKLKEHARRLRLYNIANRMDSILHHAQEEKPTYSEFLSLVLGKHSINSPFHSKNVILLL